MKNAQMLLVLLVSLVALWGCTPEGDDQDDNIIKQMNSDTAALAPILGNWEGPLVLSRTGQTIPVRIEIREEKVEEGTTTRGRTIYRIKPRATFSTTEDPRFPTVSLKGEFYPETGQIPFDRRGNVGSEDELYSLSLVYSNGTITGAVYTSSYLVGNVRLVRTGEQASNPGGLDEEERRYLAERRTYEPLIGEFYGTVSGKQRNGALCFNMCLRIYFQETSTPTGKKRWIPRAYYKRDDFESAPEIGEKILAITYNYRTPPRNVVMTTEGVTQPLPGNYTVQISGDLYPSPEVLDIGTPVNEIIGTHLAINLGLSGPMTLRRVGACPIVDRKPGKCTPARPPTEPRNELRTPPPTEPGNIPRRRDGKIPLPRPRPQR